MKKVSPDIEIYETSRRGNTHTRIAKVESGSEEIEVTILPDQTYQTITGFGGSFTDASAYLMSRLGQENQKKIIEAYFGETGARYSLTRTHINSCDFSLENYSYAPVECDKDLNHFSAERDRKYLFAMIKQALDTSKDGFKIIASPWTAPPWMKDNGEWCGGKLLPEYYGTWALYFSKYLTACQTEGINIWGITVENEPLGNNENWESMHYTPGEMNHFVKHFLKPQLSADEHTVKIFGYDQNRGPELREWVDAMYGSTETASLYDGTAVHWYESTTKIFANELQYAHNAAPQKYLIQTEACIDDEVPRWRDDSWYWAKEATDWGYKWAADAQKHLHPRYVPAFRYARDIIGCLNNFVDGWIDWNMVLDRRGGPNHAENWCTAPVIADPDSDEVYFTPLYSILMHFSRYIRPGAKRLGCLNKDDQIMATAAENPDGSIAVVIFNPEKKKRIIKLTCKNNTFNFSIDEMAIQTIIIT